MAAGALCLLCPAAEGQAAGHESQIRGDPAPFGGPAESLASRGREGRLAATRCRALPRAAAMVYVCVEPSFMLCRV